MHALLISIFIWFLMILITLSYILTSLVYYLLYYTDIHLFIPFILYRHAFDPFTFIHAAITFVRTKKEGEEVVRIWRKEQENTSYYYFLLVCMYVIHASPYIVITFHMHTYVHVYVYIIYLYCIVTYCMYIHHYLLVFVFILVYLLTTIIHLYGMAALHVSFSYPSQTATDTCGKYMCD